MTVARRAPRISGVGGTRSGTGEYANRLAAHPHLREEASAWQFGQPASPLSRADLRCRLPSESGFLRERGPWDRQPLPPSAISAILSDAGTWRAWTHTVDTRFGTCGWSFQDWRGSFYPDEVKDDLAYYAAQFDAVEIDSTWYRIPSARTVDGWRRRTPEGFLFCPKLPGEITHENMLDGSQELLSLFVETISRLGDKLGPILVQLHPRFTYEALPVLRGFLERLPSDLRYAVEFRHKSWLGKPDALSLLRDLKIGLVMAHHPWYPRFKEATADFAYLRLLGRRDVFPDFSRVHRQQDDALQEWVEVMRSLAPEIERAFIFVNNQFEGHSPDTVRRLRTMLQP